MEINYVREVNNLRCSSRATFMQRRIVPFPSMEVLEADGTREDSISLSANAVIPRMW